MSLHPVVLAAGEGRRLRPLTERWPKPVLPIEGRPVIAMLAHELAAAGFERATIVTGHLAEQVERLLGDGSAFGLELSYVRQPRADGSADALRRAVAGGAEAPLLITAADTVYTAGDLARFSAAFSSSNAAGALAVRRDPPPGPGRPAVRVEDGLVVRLFDDTPGNPLGSAPLWAMSTELVPRLEQLPGPPYELADVYGPAVAAGAAVLAVEIGATRDLTAPVDLIRHNFTYLESEE